LTSSFCTFLLVPTYHFFREGPFSSHHYIRVFLIVIYLIQFFTNQHDTTAIAVPTATANNENNNKMQEKPDAPGVPSGIGGNDNGNKLQEKPNAPAVPTGIGGNENDNTM
jgi:hypothetical protein